MLKFNEFIYEADDVATKLREPAQGTPTPPNTETPKTGVNSELSKKIGDLISKVKTGKTAPEEKPTTGGVTLDKNTKYITIESDKGDKYELTFGGEITGKVQANKSYPTYSIKTDDEEIKNQVKQTMVVDDDTYGKLKSALESIDKWKTSAPNQQQQKQTAPPPKTPPATNPPTTPPPATNPPTTPTKESISKFSELYKVNEEVSNPQNFDSFIISQFTNQQTYGRYENWKEVAGALMVVKEKYPTLYSKSLGELLKLMKGNSIVKESEKTRFVTRWFILKHSDQDKKYYLVRSGKNINPGDFICFQKYVTRGSSKTTQPFKVKNALVEKAEAPQPEQKF